jgi:hypothetical protein
MRRMIKSLAFGARSARPTHEQCTAPAVLVVVSVLIVILISGPFSSGKAWLFGKLLVSCVRFSSSLPPKRTRARNPRAKSMDPYVCPNNTGHVNWRCRNIRHKDNPGTVGWISINGDHHPRAETVNPNRSIVVVIATAKEVSTDTNASTEAPNSQTETVNPDGSTTVTKAGRKERDADGAADPCG